MITISVFSDGETYESNFVCVYVNADEYQKIENGEKVYNVIGHGRASGKEESPSDAQLCIYVCNDMETYDTEIFDNVEVSEVEYDRILSGEKAYNVIGWNRLNGWNHLKA